MHICYVTDNFTQRGVCVTGATIMGVYIYIYIYINGHVRIMIITERLMSVMISQITRNSVGFQELIKANTIKTSRFRITGLLWGEFTSDWRIPVNLWPQ